MAEPEAGMKLERLAKSVHRARPMARILADLRARLPDVLADIVMGYTRPFECAMVTLLESGEWIEFTDVDDDDWPIDVDARVVSCDGSRHLAEVRTSDQALNFEYGVSVDEVESATSASFGRANLLCVLRDLIESRLAA